MRKIGYLLLFALVLVLAFPASGVLAEAAEADYAITLTADATEVNAGQKVTLTAAFANPETVNQKAKNNQITWKVTNAAGEKTNAANINPQGVVTTQRNVKEKTVVVATATAKSMPSQTASVEITIVPLASKVTVRADTDILYPQEGYNTVRLTAEIEPTDAGRSVTWKSSNEKVATVDAEGLVTAVGGGTANITATAQDGSNAKANFKITVGVPVGMLNSMTHTGTGSLVAGKGSVNFSVKEFYDAEGNKINPTNKNITWSVEAKPESAAQHISIDKNGKLTATGDCPPAQVKVTAAADGSLPAGSATYSSEIYVLPASPAETVRTESMDDFYGRWHVFMTAANGKTDGAVNALMKIGIYDLEYEILESDGRPVAVILIEGSQYGAFYVNLKDGALYTDQEQLAFELCTDGTMLQHVLALPGGKTQLYCFRTSSTKRVVNSDSGQQEEQGESGTYMTEDGELDRTALLEMLTGIPGGIPETIDEIPGGCDRELFRTLHDQLRPLDLLDALLAKGTCSFPALDSEWNGPEPGFFYYRTQEEEQYIAFDNTEGSMEAADEQVTEGSMEIADGQITLSLGQELPENLLECTLGLWYNSTVRVCTQIVYDPERGEEWTESIGKYPDGSIGAKDGYVCYCNQSLDWDIYGNDGFICTMEVVHKLETLFIWRGIYAEDGTLDGSEFFHPD